MPSILITGASAGIGRAVAELFLAEGWTVGLLARRKEVLDEIADGQSKAHVLVADVADPEAVRAAFDGVCRESRPSGCAVQQRGAFYARSHD